MKSCGIFLLSLFSLTFVSAQAPVGLYLPPDYFPENSTTLSATANIETIPQAHPRVDEALRDSLHSVLETMSVQLDVKSLSAAIRLPDGDIWADAVGVSEEAPEVLMTPNHRLAVGSTSKTLIAATIFDLYEEEALDLDAKVSDFGIDYEQIDPNITIKQLLRHESGIYNYTDHPDFTPTLQASPLQFYSLDNILTSFVGDPLFSPGATFMYSNSNYVVLALIIEEVTGASYHTEIRNRFLNPLNLQKTFLPLAESWQGPIGHLWIDSGGDGTLDDFHNSFISWNALLTCISAAGGYFSTPSDMAEWMYHFQSSTLFTTETMGEVNEMINTTLPLNTQYGLGVMRRLIDGEEAFGHQGDISYSTHAWYLPDLDIGVSIICNDGSINSWNLHPVTVALISTYKNYLITSTEAPLWEESTSVSAFPNPARDEIEFITTNGWIKTIEWYDWSGRSLNRLSANTTAVQADLSAFASGVYYAKIITNQGPEVLKIIKTN